MNSVANSLVGTIQHYLQRFQNGLIVIIIIIIIIVIIIIIMVVLNDYLWIVI